MNRLLAFFAALTLTAITVSSSCLASSPDNLRFTLKPSTSGAELHLSLRSGNDDHRSSMGSSFAASDLRGLDLAALRSGGNSPVRFSLVREAGQIDCAGTGGNAVANGTCSFTADPAFAQYLASRRIQRPSREEAFHLTMVNAGRPLVEAVDAASYPMADIDQLTALAAVKVTPAYITELARRGYKPASLDDLVTFRALDITPAYIDAMARSGYRNLDAGAIVQFKALGITPEFIAGFERIGYRGLPVDTLVQLKALKVTPDYVADLRRAGISPPSADQLVKLGAIGFTPQNRR